MDKFLNLDDVFNLSIYNFNPMLLIPAIVVVIGAVTVFVFGFKKAESPKFRKISETNNSNKRKKRATLAATEQSPVSVPSTVANKSLKQTAQQQQQQQFERRNVKKEVPVTTAPKQNSIPSKVTDKKSVATKKQTKAKDIKVKSKVKEAKSSVSVGNNFNDGDGEWQTVKSKKQKKQTDTLIQAVAEVAAGVVNNSKRGNKSKVVEKHVENVVDDNAAVTVVTLEKTSEKTVVEAKQAFKVTPALAPLEHTKTITNLVFDEFEDTKWTETKAPKSNKKRALKE